MQLENQFLEPGQTVFNPARADWGVGQIQSIDGNRITANFENAGKLVLDGRAVALEECGEDHHPSLHGSPLVGEEV